jgi:hypothetical protein
MQTFDFTQISSKYPLLKDKDVSFLNEFFNSPDILTVISDSEDKRKK